MAMAMAFTTRMTCVKTHLLGLRFKLTDARIPMGTVLIVRLRPNVALTRTTSTVYQPTWITMEPATCSTPMLTVTEPSTWTKSLREPTQWMRTLSQQTCYQPVRSTILWKWMECQLPLTAMLLSLHSLVQRHKLA